MKRQAIAFLIGFLAPVILAWGLVVYAYVYCHWPSNSHEMRGLSTWLATRYVGWPSIPVGLVIGSVAAYLTRSKPGPLKCGKCGYSHVGLTSDRCPECGEPTKCGKCGYCLLGLRSDKCPECGEPLS